MFIFVQNILGMSDLNLFTGVFIKWQLILYGVDIYPIRLRKPGQNVDYDTSDESQEYIGNSEGMKKYGLVLDEEDFANSHRLRPNIQNYRSSNETDNREELSKIYDTLYDLNN